MILRHVLFSVLCGYLVVISDSQSQETQRPRSAKSAAKDERGTDKSPLVIKGFPATKSKEEADSETKERAQQAAEIQSIRKSIAGLERDSERTTVLTFLLFLAASIQVGLFWWQLRLIASTVKDAKTSADSAKAIAAATKASVDQMRDTARKELRAYLGTGSGSEMFPLPNRTLRGVVEIKNFGQTPAHKVTPAIAGELREPGDTRTFVDPEFIRHTQPIAPTMSWTFGHEFHGMTEQDLQDVLADRKLVYIWGRVKYEDIYGDSHIVRFRFRNVVKVFESTPEGALRIIRWKFYPEDEGNEAT